MCLMYTSLKTIIHGVPERSILGPFFFLIDVLNHAVVSEHILFILFADDSDMFMCNKCLLLVQTFNAEIDRVWDGVKLIYSCLTL